MAHLGSRQPLLPIIDKKEPTTPTQHDTGLAPYAIVDYKSATTTTLVRRTIYNRTGSRGVN